VLHGLTVAFSVPHLGDHPPWSPVSAEPSARSRTTALLHPLSAADALPADAVERLVPLLYDELRTMAHRQIAREHGRATLQTTELVHEAYLRLVDQSVVAQRGRAYFFAAAAQAMRRVLVDRARSRSAAKRGGGRAAVSLLDVEAEVIAVDALAGELLDLDAALQQLAALEPRKARVVECRYFAGLTVEETAEALSVSPRTVKMDWAFARAWLFKALGEGHAG
jgi:RNA polymerase sigma-70 factor (ECF subfamily)